MILRMGGGGGEGMANKSIQKQSKMSPHPATTELWEFRIFVCFTKNINISKGNRSVFIDGPHKHYVMTYRSWVLKTISSYYKRFTQNSRLAKQLMKYSDKLEMDSFN